MRHSAKTVISILLATVLMCIVFSMAGCEKTKTPGPDSEITAPGGDPEEPGSSDKGDPDAGTPQTGYYAPITAKSGDALLGQLHDLITTTHTHYTSYSECRDNAPVTDYAEGGKSIIEFYTHETITYYINDTVPEGTVTSGDAGKWNREHVWPKSLSNNLWKGSNTVGGGADMHHIRPSEVKMNGVRGDDKYGEVTGGSPVYSKKLDGSNSMLGGYRAGGVFEPNDDVKGDVARILFYVYTHYNTYANVHGTTNGNTNGQTETYFGTLHFTHIVSAPSEEAAIEMLLAWHALDPVDEIETARNEEVFKIQHNRNPFIDNPLYAPAIWSAA